MSEILKSQRLCLCLLRLRDPPIWRCRIHPKPWFGSFNVYILQYHVGSRGEKKLQLHVLHDNAQQALDVFDEGVFGLKLQLS